MDNYQSQFKDFLDKVEQTEFDINTTATGSRIIQQSHRNLLRKEGVAAFKADLEWLYGDLFDVVETKDGIVIVAENEPGDFTFSWEVKTTIKSIDYDPFIEAEMYDADCEAKEAKKVAREEAKAAKEAEIEKKRQRKLAEIEAKAHKGE